MRIARWAFPTLTAAVALGVLGTARADSDRHAWEMIAGLRFQQAYEASRLSNSASSRLAAAVAMIQRQPVTESNLAAAATTLDSLRRAPDTPRDIVVAATYQLARLRQFNPFGPDPVSAIATYEQCIEADPSHPLAQAAVAKMAIVSIYTAPDAAKRAALFEAFEKRAAQLTDPSARRDLHLTLATAAMHFEIGAETSLRHLKLVDESSVVKARSLADLLVRRGEMARSSGDDASARTAYAHFVKTFPSDPRSYWVNTQLKALDDAHAKETP